MAGGVELAGVGVELIPDPTSSTNLVIGTTTISGGTNGRLLYDNNGLLGETPSWTTDGATLTGASGTVTTSQPILNLTQTWNAGGVTFTGLKLNITDTASAAGSKLLDLQVASATKFNVGKDGGVTTATNGRCFFGAVDLEPDAIFSFYGSGTINDGFYTIQAPNHSGGGGAVLNVNIGNGTTGAVAPLSFVANTAGFAAATFAQIGNGHVGVDLLQEGLGDAYVRYGINSPLQTWCAGVRNAGSFAISASNSLGTTDVVRITTTGAFTHLPAANATAITVAPVTHTASAPVFTATQTINGAVGAIGMFYNMVPGGTPPTLASTFLMQLQYNSADIFTVRRDGLGFFAAGLTISGNFVIPAASKYYFTGRANIGSSSTTSLAFYDSTEADAPIVQWGGTTSSFPGLDRSGTVLRARLADKSNFAPLQGLLRTAANAVAETITPDHTIVITDASGQAYRVPCQV